MRVFLSILIFCLAVSVQGQKTIRDVIKKNEPRMEEPKTEEPVTTEQQAPQATIPLAYQQMIKRKFAEIQQALRALNNGMADMGRSIPLVARSDGTVVSGRPGRMRQIVEIVDTVRMSGGFGTVTFSGVMDGYRHSTQPVDSQRVYAWFTQRTVDTTDTPPSYSYKLVFDDQDNIVGTRVISSDGNDSCRVDVLMKIQ